MKVELEPWNSDRCRCGSAARGQGRNPRITPGLAMEPVPSAGQLPARVVLLFAVACGLSVANIYYAQPLLDAMARDFAVAPASIGIVVTMTQIGYALGLIFIVPLGDLLDRRRLIVGQAALSALALIAVGWAPTAITLLAAMMAVGLLAVVVQVLVAFAATLAAPEERGSVVGRVTSGVVIGILLARFVSGTVADVAGWRSAYLASALLTLVMAGVSAARAAAPCRSRRRAVLSAIAAVHGRPVSRRADPARPRNPGVADLRSLQRAVDCDGPAAECAAVLAVAYPGRPVRPCRRGRALAAGRAGRLADRGLAQWTTGIALTLMLLAWIPVALMGVSLWILMVGIVVLDFRCRRFTSPTRA